MHAVVALFLGQKTMGDRAGVFVEPTAGTLGSGWMARPKGREVEGVLGVRLLYPGAAPQVLSVDDSLVPLDS